MTVVFKTEKSSLQWDPLDPRNAGKSSIETGHDSIILHSRNLLLVGYTAERLWADSTMGKPSSFDWSAQVDNEFSIDELAEHLDRNERVCLSVDGHSDDEDIDDYSAKMNAYSGISYLESKYPGRINFVFAVDFFDADSTDDICRFFDAVLDADDEDAVGNASSLERLVATHDTQTIGKDFRIFLGVPQPDDESNDQGNINLTGDAGISKTVLGISAGIAATAALAGALIYGAKHSKSVIK